MGRELQKRFEEFFKSEAGQDAQRRTFEIAGATPEEATRLAELTRGTSPEALEFQREAGAITKRAGADTSGTVQEMLERFRLRGGVNERVEMLGRREQAALGQLREQTTAGLSAVDELLRQRLSGLEEQAGEARRVTGETFGARGLGRSTLAAQRVGEIGEMEFTGRGQARSEAEQQRRAIQEREAKVVQNIADTRFDIETRLQQLELQGINNLRFQEESQALKREFDQFIGNLGLEAQRSQDLMNLFTGLGELGGIFAGAQFGSNGTTVDTSTPTGTPGFTTTLTRESTAIDPALALPGSTPIE